MEKTQGTGCLPSFCLGVFVERSVLTLSVLMYECTDGLSDDSALGALKDVLIAAT